MPASFLHGVETIEITKGARTITTVKTAVVGIVGTAPIEDVQGEYKTINTPTLIMNEIEAVRYFGNHKAGFTIPQALQAIFDQGAGIAIVINVYDPEKHEKIVILYLAITLKQLLHLYFVRKRLLLLK